MANSRCRAIVADSMKCAVIDTCNDVDGSGVTELPAYLDMSDFFETVEAPMGQRIAVTNHNRKHPCRPQQGIACSAWSRNH